MPEITPHAVLRALQAHGSTSPAALREALAAGSPERQQAVLQSLAALKQRGLVTRHPSGGLQLLGPPSPLAVPRGAMRTPGQPPLVPSRNTPRTPQAAAAAAPPADSRAVLPMDDAPADIKALAALRELMRRPPAAVPVHPDVEAAAAWARQNIRGLRHVDYSGLEPEFANTLNRVVRQISEEFRVEVPALMPQDWSGWRGRSDAFMSADGSGLRFNPEECTGPRRALFLGPWELGLHTSQAAKGLEATIAHEMAHLLRDNGRTRSGVQLPRETSRTIVRTIVNAYRDAQGEEAIIKELAVYAWYGRGTGSGAPAADAWDETWAQAFSACWMNKRNVQPPTRRMGENVLKALHLR
ncbi:MAG TPA: hypothetical protein VK689_12800 [Armatimonadota bacterium]|nr:hypothetical protein [Armatimonadota bacterium]